LDLAERRDGRQRVADKLAVDRHDPGVASQLDELFESRKVAHGASVAERCPEGTTCGLHGLTAAEKGSIVQNRPALRSSLCSPPRALRLCAQLEKKKLRAEAQSTRRRTQRGNSYGPRASRR